MSIIFRYCSDLHLEMYDFTDTTLWDFTKDFDNKYYLALLGDIGYPKSPRLDSFLEKISSIYDKVFYVPGNHEYYQDNTTYLQCKSILQKLCDKHNVILLDNSSHIDGNYKFIGTTLWSHVPDGSKYYITKNINDYRYILDDDHYPITVDDTNEWNAECRKFIIHELDSKYKCILLTHHAPLFSNKETSQFTASEKYLIGPNNYAFHNDLKDIIASPIVAWFYGHTHYVSKFILNDVIIATNQRGYGNECSNFNPTSYVEFPV